VSFVRRRSSSPPSSSSSLSSSLCVALRGACFQNTRARATFHTPSVRSLLFEYLLAVCRLSPYHLSLSLSLSLSVVIVIVIVVVSHPWHFLFFASPSETPRTEMQTREWLRNEE